MRLPADRLPADLPGPLCGANVPLCGHKTPHKPAFPMLGACVLQTLQYPGKRDHTIDSRRLPRPLPSGPALRPPALAPRFRTDGSCDQFLALPFLGLPLIAGGVPTLASEISGGTPESDGGTPESAASSVYSSGFCAGTANTSRGGVESSGDSIPCSSLNRFACVTTLRSSDELKVLNELTRLLIRLLSVCKWLPIVRSEEHTSELQSRGHLVCRLLLEKEQINV